MRIAVIEAPTCTFCFAKEQTDVLATHILPFSFEWLADGGFTFTYDPHGDNEEHKAGACEVHSEAIGGEFATFGEAVSGIVQMIEHEENPVLVATEDDELDDDENGGDDDEEPLLDEGDAQAVRDHLNGSAGTMGEKIIPTEPAKDEEEVLGVDVSQPSAAEKVALGTWWTMLTAAEKRKIKAPARAGRVAQATIKAWRESKYYQEWLKVTA